jgi:hypothetical protein
MNRRHLAAVAATALLAVVFSACASPHSAGSAPDSPSLGAVSPGLPAGTVTAQGLVLDDGDSPMLCLGPVAESAPPQCTGIPLTGWSWSGVDGSEVMSGTRWGSYAVQGTYDGESFTITQPPVMLALFDPMPLADPTEGKAGSGTDAELQKIQESLHDRLGAAYFASTPENGWLWVDVLWDDGTWQDAADGEFGAGKVIIRPALHEVE